MSLTRRARRLLVGLVAAFGLLWTSTAHADPVPITAGAGLDWGVKESWRNYITAGGTTLSAGATRNADGTFHFPVTGGSYDAATRATIVRFGGSVEFLGHCEGAQPYERPCALDMTVTNPWVEINEDRAIVHAQMRSRPREGGEITDYPDVPIAALGVEDATPVIAGGKTTWSNLASTMTLAGSDVFTYAVGTVIDPVTFGYDGPGGKPLGEVFAEAGIATYAREPIADGDRPRWTVSGKTGGPLVGIHLGIISSGLSLIDPVTFAVVPGSRYTGAYGAFGSVASDPTTGTVFSTQSSGGIRTFTWDGSAWTATVLENSTLAGSNAGGATWDPQGRRYLVSRTVGSDNQLWQVVQVAGVWTASKVGSVRQTTTLPAPLIQSMIAVPNGNPASTAVILVTWFGQIHRLTFAPDGIVAEPLTNAPGVTGNKLLKTDNGAYAVQDGRATFIPVPGTATNKTMGTALAPVTIPGSAGLNALDTGFVAVDPARDRLYVPSLNLTRIMRIDAGQLKHSFAVPGATRVNYFADFLAGVNTAGNLVIESDTESKAFSLAYQNAAPSFTTAPADTTVDLKGASATATLTVAATGDPAPTVRWQTRLPGQATWTDVAGATANTLTTTVTTADGGRQYRVLATSSAGTVASPRATLTLHTAPSVAVQPDPQTVVAGSSAQFKVMDAGSPDPVITWQQLVGGFWRDVDASSGDFEVDGGFLTVLETRSAMTGTQFRARLSSPLGTVFSRAVTLTVQTPLTEPVTIRGGNLDWGFANRWRCYVVGSVAHGGIELGGGVTRLPGTLATGSLCPTNAGSEALRFPVTGGAYDPQTKKLSVSLAGTVRFWGHVTGGTPVLDTRFSNLRLEADGQTATLYGDASGSTMTDSTVKTWSGVALVSVDLAGAGPTVQDGRIVWTAAPTTLTAAGSSVFGGYPTGEPFDPLTLSASAEPTALPEEETPTPPVQILQTIQHITQVLPAPLPAPAAAPSITARTATQALGKSRVATLATLRCPAGATACTVKAPKRVNVTVGGKRYALTVVAPATLKPGATGTLRVRVPVAAAKRLAGRTTTVTVKLTVGAASKTVKVKVKRAK
ncbi:HtaA domain-containing protein [Solirubrobacter phytolaccae]|uniref:HtaA domain-containing protein n=1 Tax=Solirubrobacter phytolaccae TaxID=1404360 RepID=A0A9X3N5I8_9ACTN|nr:HtaA domain-containing protein [Solirubrobacter phytolaccae]MDA0180029.1 HtaA domain-containing protein [Solirubrobacter phytolaccae]